MCEKAQESCIKFIKKYREDFSRNTSGELVKNIEDVFSRLLVSSDSMMSSIRKLFSKPLRALNPEVIKLLKVPTEDSLKPSILASSSSEESVDSSDEEH